MTLSKFNLQTLSKRPIRFLSLAPALFLTACSVCHEGLSPTYQEGQVHDVSCSIVINSEIDGSRVSSLVEATAQVCSYGAPSRRLQNDSCQAVATTNIPNFRADFPGFDGVDSVDATGSNMVDSCRLAPDVESGEGEILSRTDSLSGSTAMLNDNSGQILGNNSLTNGSATVDSSKITVGAEFLKWRFAETTARGDVVFDRLRCNALNECDLILRKISLDLADFTIVRPTIFARDVHVSKARIYTLNNYQTRVDRDGRFSISGVKAIISSVIDGENVNLMSGQRLTITGQFGDNLQGRRHASQSLKLKINDVNHNFYVNADVDFAINKFSTKLLNYSSNRCLTGAKKQRHITATVTDCGKKHSYQRWSIERAGEYMKIRQPISNTCLNVKSASQNREGGEVSIVECSNHVDQHWKVNSDYRIMHEKTGKCLNVHGREWRDGGLVSIYSCAKTKDQYWGLRTAY